MTAPRKTKKAAACPAVAAPVPDELTARLIEAGFVPNPYILDLNGGLQVPHAMELPAPWNLPSRLFRFPVEIGKRKDGTRRIGLMHALLSGHPFVQQIEAALGFQLDPHGAPNDYGYSQTETAKWWHAVDLVSAGKWRDLLATAEFTTPGHIAGAVAYGLDYSHRQGEEKGSGYITTADAREIMGAIGSAEPPDRAMTLRSFQTPSSCKQDGGKVAWPINEAGPPDAPARAWGRIVGIEAGWFAHDRSGFLNWTEMGRARFAARDDSTYVEASGQAAFAF